MPAYRSPAEAEVRDAVVARLRVLRPGARIMHEVNTAGTGSNRIDVLAVDRAEIIAVEIKSEKDKLARLPDQIVAMKGVAHIVIAALHEKHLATKKSRSIDGFSWFEAPDEARRATVWAYPEAGAEARRGWGVARWEDPRPQPTCALPTSVLDMLWAEELRQLCSDFGVAMRARPSRGQMMNSIRWNCTGAQITKGACAMLRARACIEADPACEVAA